MAENAFPALWTAPPGSPVCVLSRCCRTFPFRYRVRFSQTKRASRSQFPGDGIPAVADTAACTLKQPDAMKNHQDAMKLQLLSAVRTFHGMPPPRWNGFLWVNGCLTAWKRKDMGFASPDCRLTALLCAPDLLPAEVHARSWFSAVLLRRRGFIHRSPVDGMMIARKKRLVIQPLV